MASSELAQPLVKVRVALGESLLEFVIEGIGILARRVLQIPFDSVQADARIRRLVHGHQVERLGVEQEQNAIEQRERGVVGLIEKIVTRLGLLVEMLAAVLDEAFGEIREHFLKDAVTQPVAQLFGECFRAETKLVEETDRLIFCWCTRHWRDRCERLRAEEVVEIAKCV